MVVNRQRGAEKASQRSGSELGHAGPCEQSPGSARGRCFGAEDEGEGGACGGLVGSARESHLMRKDLGQSGDDAGGAAPRGP